MGLNQRIDKITNSIEERKTGLTLETKVLPLAKHELLKIRKADGWKFSWRKEMAMGNRIVYKLIIVNEPSKVQGLLCLSIEEGFIFMHLIESAPGNIGSLKHYMGVPANLVAFACKLSFEYGFSGEIAFDSKTVLINHYKRTLGAILLFPPKRMAILSEQAGKLVNSYYKDFKI